MSGRFAASGPRSTQAGCDELDADAPPADGCHTLTRFRYIRNIATKGRRGSQQGGVARPPGASAALGGWWPRRRFRG